MDELTSKGVDLAQYTTTAWIADLEAMREALGYPRWNLWGGSYGTRVAQEYLRTHADRVRTMMLDGVAPPGMIISLDVWPTREAVLAAILKACERVATVRESASGRGGHARAHRRESLGDGGTRRRHRRPAHRQDRSACA